MSALTRCNFCTLNDIGKFAAATKRKVTLVETHRKVEVDGEEHDINGTDVLIGGVFIAWLWEIPDHCVCYE